MRAVFGVCVVGALLLGVTLEAGAQAAAPDEEGWLSGNVALASDYAFRGISQTLEEPSVQGGIDLEHPSGLYLGVWGASVNFGEDLDAGARAQMELDVYSGLEVDVPGRAALEVGATYYAYPGAGGARHYDFIELGVGLGREVGRLSTQATLAYSPDFYAASGAGLYYGVSLGVPVSRAVVSGSVGRQRIEDNVAFGTPDYTDWAVGAAVEWAGFGLSGSYLGTDLGEEECFGGSRLCEPRAVFGVSRSM